MRFSERMGQKQVRGELQVNGMDTPLRTSLWNVVYVALFERLSNARHGTPLATALDSVVRKLLVEFFRWSLDDIPRYTSELDTNGKIRHWFFNAEWYEVYDFLEFLSSVHGYFEDKFRNECNNVLLRENSGYRFVGKEISPIVDNSEIREVEQAVKDCGSHKLNGAKKHMETALEKLSDRPKPDYRNSIKESISAVESVCATISGDRNLGQALKKIKDSVGLHPALEKGMSSIYGYTSDADGIRHAMIEESDCDLADAKYMLVSCSAFINYLIMKAEKAGLLK